MGWSSAVRAFRTRPSRAHNDGFTAFLMRPKGQVVQCCPPKFQASESNQLRTLGQKSACRTALNSAARARDTSQKKVCKAMWKSWCTSCTWTVANAVRTFARQSFGINPDGTKEFYTGPHGPCGQCSPQNFRGPEFNRPLPQPETSFFSSSRCSSPTVSSASCQKPRPRFQPSMRARAPPPAGGAGRPKLVIYGMTTPPGRCFILRHLADFGKMRQVQTLRRDSSFFRNPHVVWRF